MRSRFSLVISLFSLLLLLALALNLFAGSANLPPSQTLRALLGQGDSTTLRVLWAIRVPRALSALLLGGALGLSGYLLQTFFHNPIAGPFVLGVSSGAKLAVALVMIFLAGGGWAVSSLTMIFAAFLGSLLTLGLVLLVSRRVRRMSMLVVCGVMIGYICTAITDFMVTFADDADIVNLRGWSMGSFSGSTMENVAAVSLAVAVGVLGSVLLVKPLSAYRLGEGYAQSLGINVGLLRVLLVLLSGLLSASVAAFAGPVSFVGIAAPHIVRVLTGTSKPGRMIPGSFLCGACFCLLCDMLARTAFAPTELSISTVTAIFGAPVVIGMLISRKRGEI